MNHMSHAAMVDMMPMTMNSTGGMVLTNNWRGVPIVFPGWLPTPEGIVVAGSGAHIGSCMALAVIGILFRCLAAWRARCERSWRRAQVNEYRERLPVALQEKHAAMPSLLDMPHPRFKLQGTSYVLSERLADKQWTSPECSLALWLQLFNTSSCWQS
jgi:hypothetical protein